MTARVLEITLETHTGGRVARVAVCGEKRLNLIDGDIARRCAEEIADLSTTEDLRCIVLQGRDTAAFIGGANLHVLGALEPSNAEDFIRALHEFCAVLRAAPQPVIAALRGYCLGAGLEIAAACDIRIGDTSVRCGMPEVKVGVPSVIEAALLPGLIGWGKARELMLRGNIIDAEEAARIGLLQHVVAPAALDASLDDILDDLLAAGPQALAAQKRLFLAWEAQAMPAAIESGVTAFVDAYRTDEPAQMTAAFFKRR